MFRAKNKMGWERAWRNAGCRIWLLLRFAPLTSGEKNLVFLGLLVRESRTGNMR